VVVDEIEQTPSADRRERLRQLLTYVAETIRVNETVIVRGEDPDTHCVNIG